VRVTIDVTDDEIIVSAGNARIRWVRKGPGSWSGTRKADLDRAAFAEALGMDPDDDEVEDLLDKATDLGIDLAGRVGGAA
jgi:hypothetical protein